MDERDKFTVEINVSIRKSGQSSYETKEQVSYAQSFEIPARGFTGIAKILGDLDEAVGSIKSTDTLAEALTRKYTEACNKWGTDSITAQVLFSLMDE